MCLYDGLPMTCTGVATCSKTAPVLAGTFLLSSYGVARRGAIRRAGAESRGVRGRQLSRGGPARPAVYKTPRRAVGARPESVRQTVELLSAVAEGRPLTCSDGRHDAPGRRKSDSP